MVIYTFMVITVSMFYKFLLTVQKYVGDRSLQVKVKC